MWFLIIRILFNRQAVPITQWHTLDSQNLDSVVLYISFSLGHQWSCPVRVDQSINRRSVAVSVRYNYLLTNKL